MRRFSYALALGVFAVALAVVLAGSALAAPMERDRELGDPRLKDSRAGTVIRKIVRSFFDGLTIPTPSPTPKP